LASRERDAVTGLWSPLRSEVIKEIKFVERMLPPSDRVGDPAIDVGFLPASAIGADLDLCGKGAFGDLAIDGGSGQPGAGENGLLTDDTVRLAHGCAASCWLFLTITETRQNSDLSLCN